MPNYKKSLEKQEVRLTDALLTETWMQKRKSNWTAATVNALAFVAMAISAWIIVWCIYIVFKPAPYQPIPKKRCTKCHNRQMAMTIYMRNNKVKNPDEMAAAVLATKSPKLLASIHVKGEKCTPHTARKTGYKKRHSGAWQVSEKDWGPVPYGITEQALQAELVLTEMSRNKSIRQALSHYGGDSTDAYQERVLNEFKNVP